MQGEELLANWFGWFNRTLEATADPSDIPWGWIQYAYRGYVALQAVDRAVLEPRLPPHLFYNLMLAARKPVASMSEAERPTGRPAGRRAAKPPSPMDILRDRRALVDTGLGPVAFITVNALTGLETAAIVAIGRSRSSIALCRAVRREPITNAIGGVLGTGLAVFIALRTGSASGFFVPRAFQNAGLAIAFWGSIVVRRPLVGFIVAPIYHFPSGWYRDPRIRRPFAEGTAAFAIVFSVRAVVYTVLIMLDREGALAGAVVVLGWPAFLGALWFCYRYIPRRLKQIGIDPDELRGKREH